MPRRRKETRAHDENRMPEEADQAVENQAENAEEELVDELQGARQARQQAHQESSDTSQRQAAQQSQGARQRSRKAEQQVNERMEMLIQHLRETKDDMVAVLNDLKGIFEAESEIWGERLRELAMEARMRLRRGRSTAAAGAEM